MSFAANDSVSKLDRTPPHFSRADHGFVIQARKLK
jgi:hypothetical protein